jgi:hypothetical protein
VAAVPGDVSPTPLKKKRTSARNATPEIETTRKVYNT